MTSRERLIAAARGGDVDQRPVVSWPKGDSAASDVLVLSDVSELEANVGGERPVLLEVVNPYAKAKGKLNEILKADPAAGAVLLDQAVADVKSEIEEALAKGADGIFYLLHGAQSSLCTPMQYGGYYLERDREILDLYKDSVLNVLFVVGGDDAYLDFVSDLPAHVFAWDRDASGFSSDYVRTLRSGAQASSDPSSEIALVHPGIRIAETLDLN